MVTPSRHRLFDLALGALIGLLLAGASSMYMVGNRVAALEVQVQYLRADVDRLLRR